MTKFTSKAAKAAPATVAATDVDSNKVEGLPSYEVMITAALVALDVGVKGATRGTIRKYIIASYNVSPGSAFESLFTAGIKRGLDKDIFAKGDGVTMVALGPKGGGAAAGKENVKKTSRVASMDKLAEETEKAAILKKDEITSRARNAKAAKKEKSASKIGPIRAKKVIAAQAKKVVVAKAKKVVEVVEIKIVAPRAVPRDRTIPVVSAPKPVKVAKVKVVKEKVIKEKKEKVVKEKVVKPVKEKVVKPVKEKVVKPVKVIKEKVVKVVEEKVGKPKVVKEKKVKAAVKPAVVKVSKAVVKAPKKTNTAKVLAKKAIVKKPAAKK